MPRCPKIALFLLPLLAGLPDGNLAGERESVLDRVVHLEEHAILEVPTTPRLDDGLDLTVRRIDVGGAELHVEEEGSGVPLVLLHGGPGGTHHDFHAWFGQARDFARIIYYDQRGTGLSDYEPGPDGYSVEQAVGDLDALRRALGIDRWALVGFSYGGFLAQYYTTTYPEKVSGLVLVGAKPGMWTDLGRSQQYVYISQEEVDRMREVRDELRALREREGWPREKYVKLLIYNNHVNGDWKRQSLYRPTPEELAHVVLYEWVHDDGFNGVMSESASKVDLTGAFERNPIPTLLLEGKWDLTWGMEKPTILSRNHPRARMIVVEGAGHSIYDENPEAFFAALQEFVRGLAPVPESALAAYREDLAAWRARWWGSPRFHLKAAGWGRSGSRRIAEAYSSEWLEALGQPSELLRVGFALYDTERYAEALDAFARLQKLAEERGNRGRTAVALIWQGHVLDLLGRRDEAVTRYRRVVEMDSRDRVRHEQYGLSYEHSAYAAERLATPHQRIDNTDP